SASKPSAPEPAKRSITRAPRTPVDQGACSRMLKIAWRARSDVGRVAWPGGATRVLPRNSPETMRNRALLAAALLPFQGSRQQSSEEAAMGLVTVEHRGGAAVVTYANPPIGT